MSVETIGERIKKVRKEHELTQKALGALCGIPEVMIRRYELGLRNPKIETIEKIVKFLGGSVDYFRYGTGTKPSKPNIEIDDISGLNGEKGYILYSVVDNSILAHYLFVIYNNNKAIYFDYYKEIEQIEYINSIILNTEVSNVEKDKLRLDFCNAIFKNKASSLKIITPPKYEDLNEQEKKDHDLFKLTMEEREKFISTESNDIDAVQND